MATATETTPAISEFPGLGARGAPGGRMYAIALDLDIVALRGNYGNPCNPANAEIRRVLQKHGFRWQQGSVYFGNEQVNMVSCVLAAQDLARSLPWFTACVRYIRMLRIEDNNDLMPAIQQAAQ